MTKLLLNLKEKKFRSKLSGIVVAIGVNDALRRDFPANYAIDWEKSYEEMIDIALQLHPKVFVSTILPVEDDMPLGSKYFDQSLIELLNTSIRQVAKKKNVRLIDMSKTFQNTAQKMNFTVDGVHLTTGAYKIFTKQLIGVMPENCRSATFEKKQHHGEHLK